MVIDADQNVVGRYGEDLAARYLTAEGFVILERNWRCELGEIDIVARDGDALVICEVKTRRGLNYGSPLESITYRKLTTLPELAGRWLQTHQLRPAAIRIDIVAIVFDNNTAARGPREGRGLMPLAQTWSVALVGLEGHLVEVEADIAQGLPKTTLIGLPDASLSEARDRVRAAGRAAASDSPTARSPSASLRPRCPRRARTMTSPSRARCSRRPV